MPALIQPQNTLLHHYESLVKAGSLTPDPAQRSVAETLQHLADTLLLPHKKGLFSFRKLKPTPKSLYIWGDVGRGKSLLMDMFFQHVAMEAKQRIHFHSLMLFVHESIHRLRKEAVADPLIATAGIIAARTRLLCLDEFQVTDVADAMLLNRLFKELLRQQVVCVFTSNRPPDQLYLGGLQREKFLEFVALVQETMAIIELASPTDYRMQQIRSLACVYMLEKEKALFEAAYQQLTSHGVIAPLSLEVMGRTLDVEKTCGSIARFTFAAICEKPLGAADYLAIANQFDTVFLEDIPVLTQDKRNEARRFVTLIDTLYDNHITLICTAADYPAALYPVGDGSFEFARTVSRLMEMQSERYVMKAGEIPAGNEGE